MVSNSGHDTQDKDWLVAERPSGPLRQRLRRKIGIDAPSSMMSAWETSLSSTIRVRSIATTMTTITPRATTRRKYV
eukprot:8699308-Pyramimonas_sp.AAC.1